MNLRGCDELTHFRYDFKLTSNRGSRASQSNHSTTSGRSTSCFNSDTVNFCSSALSSNTIREVTTYSSRPPLSPSQARLCCRPRSRLCLVLLIILVLFIRVVHFRLGCPSIRILCFSSFCAFIEMIEDGSESRVAWIRRVWNG
jgi:hypothetical protein